MSQSDHSKKPPVEDDLSVLVDKAFKELGASRSELQEKERIMINIINESMVKIKEFSKINQGLRDKVEFLLDISTSLNKKNDELTRLNLELEQKSPYDEMTKDMQSRLDHVLSKEKELLLQRDFLAKQVDEKTKDLIKAEKFIVIGELAARLAHDLRNPLSVVINIVDLMRSKPHMGTEEKIEHFRKFDRAIQKINYQIDDVLNFVKKSDLMLQSTPILSIIDEAISSTILSSGIKISKPNTDVEINCDSRKLTAVFSNLIRNASQAMGDSGEIKIRIIDLGNNVEIEFEDTGHGIPLGIQSKIFEPLFTTKPTGTGLGLSICKNIVGQHGGTVVVSSPPTIFTIRLPKNISHRYTRQIYPKNTK